MKPSIMSTLTASVALALVLACGTEAGDLPFAPHPGVAAARSTSHWSPWSEPVNLGPVVNSSATDIAAALSPDGLSLYFVSTRSGGLGSNDIWVSRRASLDAAWGSPVHLGSPINSAFDDGGPSLSDDGLMLFFTSQRSGGFGLADIYVSRRTDINDDLSWGPPVNLGPHVNTAAGERGPEYVAGKHGSATLYFNLGVLAAQAADLYVAPLTRDGEAIGPAEVLADVSAPGANEAGQTVSASGKEILFHSNRTGGSGSADIWSSTRHSVERPWSAPVNLGAPVNTQFAEERPRLSRDGRTLLFDSDRPGAVGGQDLWMTTRERIDDEGEDESDAAREAETLQFSEWSTPVNLGPVVNSTVTDIEVSIAKDGLSLYLASNRPGGFGGFDLWVSRRASVSDPWGAPQNHPTRSSVATRGDSSRAGMSSDGDAARFSATRTVAGSTARGAPSPPGNLAAMRS
jgi:WD40 repeat protein